MNGAAATGAWTDFGQLARTRAAANARGADAADQREEALRGVARQFEALFVNMMLGAMRDASSGDPLFGGGEMDTYRDMLDHQLSMEMADSGSIGIADMLVRQLGPMVRQAAGAESAASPSTGITSVAIAGANPAPAAAAPAPDVTADDIAGVTPAPVAPRGWRVVSEEGGVRVSALREPGPPAVVRELPAPGTATADDIDGPEDFVARVWPHAERVAGELGIEPEVLVAQAALETGWGQHVMRRGDGPSSNNLFGIKADPCWGGGSVTVSTLEFEGGVMRRVRAPFRAYDSLAASFDDYARFVSGQARYQGALEAARAAGGDPETYIRGLHKAGYATDPDYADKVLDVMRRTISAVRGDDAAAVPA